MRLTAFLLGLCFCITAQAQIVFTANEAPAIGDTLRTTTDTIPLPGNITFPTFGTNQSWDLSGLSGDFQTVTWVVNPATTPYASDFPNATHALTQDGDAFVFFQVDANASLNEGLAGPIAGITTVPIVAEVNPPFTQYDFPTEFGNTFSGSYSSEEEIDGSDVILPPNIPISPSDVRVRINVDYTDTIKGWGVVETPLGRYDALLEQRVDIITTDIDIKIVSFGPWTDAFASTDTSVVYNWINKETKGPVATMSFDTLGNIFSVAYSLTPPPPPPTASFTWDNPSGGLVNFTNTSTDCPVSYSWDFGDGNTSIMENPANIYSANGNYTVCLVASNASGSDTTCTTVNVTGIQAGVNNPPIANTDFVTMEADTDTTFNPLGNDQDPDGNNISVAVSFGASNGTASNTASTVTYNPNPGFVGNDTVNYIICDDGTPAVACDTGIIIFTVEAAPLPTIMSFSASNDACNTLTLVNISQNVSGLVSWTVESAANPSPGTDSATVVFDTAGSYEVCILGFDQNNQLVQFCDTVTVICDTIVDGIGVANPISFNLYPNPTTGMITVDLTPFSDGDLNVLLYNATGQLVRSVTSFSDRLVELDLANLEKGVYLIQITDGAEIILGSEKVMKH